MIVIRREEELDILRRVSRLPLRLREVAMPLLTGYAVTEAAKSLGISVKAVYRRLDRIRSPRIQAALGRLTQPEPADGPIPAER